MALCSISSTIFSSASRANSHTSSPSTFQYLPPDSKSRCSLRPYPYSCSEGHERIALIDQRRRVCQFLAVDTALSPQDLVPWLGIAGPMILITLPISYLLPHGVHNHVPVFASCIAMSCPCVSSSSLQSQGSRNTCPRAQ